jgi:cell division transport system permease protein
MSRLKYFVRETLVSLRRNVMMTIAGIMTVFISLMLFGGILVVVHAVDHGTSTWRHNVELEVWMNVKATQPEIDAVQADLKADPQVKSIHFVSHEEAWTTFQQIEHGNKALLESVGPTDLPVSFLVVPTDAKLTPDVAARFSGSTGVNQVTTADKQVKALLNGIRIVRDLFFAMAAVLLAASVFLIVNTIRLATYARRREIEVMKLVGASNWFVRVPFLAEGFVQGAIGAGLAFGGVYLLESWLGGVLARSKNNVFSTFYLTHTDALSIGIIVLVIGVAIGTIGSMIGIRRFLDA